MTTDSSQSGGAEQRRYARVPINLDGLLSIAGQQPITCTVRDFCIGGMFVSAEPAAYATVKPPVPAVLYFALFVDGVKQDFQIRLSIVRAVAKGLGVSFVDADSQALELLGHLAAASAPAPVPETAHELDRTQQGFAPEFAALVEPLARLTVEHVDQICKRFLERVDDVLFLAARDAGSNVEQNRYFDGQREMRGRQKHMRETVPARIETGIRILRNPLVEDEKDAKSLGLSDLSLVDKDEFEEFLVVSELVSELEPEFYEALFALGRRFGYLANREFETSGLPIGPGVLCNAISECLKGLQSDRRVVARVYKVLHEVMSAALGAFYDAVNAMLIEHGVVAVIEKDKPAVKRRPAPIAGFDAPVPDLERTTGAQTEDDLADLMPGPEHYHGRGAPALPPGYGAAPGAPQGAVVRAAPAARPGYAPTPAPPSWPQGYPAAPGMTQVFGAAPAMPPGFVGQAPAAGGVQAAAPTFPGIVQGAAPSLPPGFAVTGAPAAFGGGAGPAAPGIHAAVPTMPGMPSIQAAVPAWPDLLPAEAGAGVGGIAAAPADGALAAFAATAGQAGGFLLPAGWATTAAHFAPPTLQHGYSTAQAQMALRRQLAPPAEPAFSGTMQARGHYTPAQIADGLSDLQASFAAAQAPQFLDVDAVKQRITEALTASGAPPQSIGGAAADAIEVVANLFSALLRDALVAKTAKTHLTRLQPSVHRAALVDEQFFVSEGHPVRRLLNRLAQVRDGKGTAFQQRNERIGELVTQANRQFHDDVGVFEPLVGELESLLEEQRDEYARNIEQVVMSCEQQQRVLEERRGQSLESTDQSIDRSDLPEEWNKWLDRSRRIEVDQRVLMNATSSNPQLHILVWKEARNNLFVFADELGNKASTLTLQQVAMYLRRGVLRLLEEDEGPALERAMFGVVDGLHSQVEAQATRDPLTGFLLRRFFVEAVDAGLAGGESGATKHAALACLSLENLKQVNDAHGTETGDALLKACADALQHSVRGKDLMFGRVSGGELAVFWPTGGIQVAYKKLQGALDALKGVSLRLLGDDDDDESADAGEATLELNAASIASATTLIGSVHADVVIGITGADDNLIQAEGLLTAAREACDTARGMGIGSIYVAGNESEQRRVFEQMVSYANKALERQCLILLAQSVTSLTDAELPPALHVTVGARDRSDKAIPSYIFGPALQRSKAAADIDLWGFRQTLAWMEAHPDELERYAVVFVPLSPASMKNENLPHLIMSEFMQVPVPPGKICFAIPDRDVVDNVTEAGELVSTLKEFGCRFVLDEFGSGHDNYEYLKRLDVDYVTIKSAFVVDARKDPKDFAMAKSINELVHFMGKKSIAKQDRGADLADTMREIGVDFLYDLTEQAQLAP